jgi:hypothetical protein
MRDAGSNLDVTQVRVLGLAHHNWMRVDVAPSDGVKGNELLSGEYRGPLPLTALVREAGPIGDLIGTFWANVFLMSDRLSKAMQELRLSGWRSLPVSVKGDPDLDNRLALLAVTGRAGPVYGAGGQTRPGVDAIGQYLDPGESDGSDVFLPANRRSILLTGAAAEKIARLGLRNVDLQPAGLEPLPESTRVAPKEK